MKITVNSIRAGHVLVHNNSLWLVAKMPEHTKPGKGGAYMQVELKNLQTGIKLHERFSSSDHVIKAELEQKDCLFLYFDDDNLVLMDNHNFEQIIVSKKIISDKLLFLVENTIVNVEFYQDKPLRVKLPSTVISLVTQTGPVIKGATATSSYKPAIITNGIRVMVPPYILTGDQIIVKTEDSSFVERAK